MAGAKPTGDGTLHVTHLAHRARPITVGDRAQSDRWLSAAEPSAQVAAPQGLLRETTGCHAFSTMSPPTRAPMHGALAHCA